MSRSVRLKGLVMAVLLVVAAVTTFGVALNGPVLSAPAAASFHDPVQDISLRTDQEKLIGPLQALLQDTQQVITATGVQSPDRPGAVATYTFAFGTPNDLDNGVDEVILTFDNEFQVPTTIDRNQLSISATALTSGTAGESVVPEEVSTDLVGPANDQPEVRLRVPDMDTSNNSGDNGIAATAMVTVVFRQGGGPHEPHRRGHGPHQDKGHQ